MAANCFTPFISPRMQRALLSNAVVIPDATGSGLSFFSTDPLAGTEAAPAALSFLAALHDALAAPLSAVLARRAADRDFIDRATRAAAAANAAAGTPIGSASYRSAIGLRDPATGRVPFGPLGPHYASAGGRPVAPLPAFLQGPHVTVFGPPDTPSACVDAMNALHVRAVGEPAACGALVEAARFDPKWGADAEDSKTPLRTGLRAAAENLQRCFDGSLRANDRPDAAAVANAFAANGNDPADAVRVRTGPGARPSLPVKRFAGLALPCPFLFRGPTKEAALAVPMHLYDVALHVWDNCAVPHALCFYIPKLESEEEAAYLRLLFATAERLLVACGRAPASYVPGTIRAIVVLENPRAIFRAHEIADALFPFFAGASLGWHDYLAAAARLFKEDPVYRIPVKADPNIVVTRIRASHELLAVTIGSRGGATIGGMYGVLAVEGDVRSARLAIKGFFRDVIVQLRRGLNGFWVAEPSCVRPGVALVEAWRVFRATGDRAPLTALVDGFLPSEGPAAGGTGTRDRDDILRLLDAAEAPGVAPSDARFPRFLIAADAPGSSVIANNDTAEVRYNVFQSLQYVAAWLAGAACEALPAVIDGAPVRVLDDLATAERSRWEVWAELRHGRFPLAAFHKIVAEEAAFIAADKTDGPKRVQIKHDARTARWYPVARRIVVRCMTDESPCEFVTELLLPFTMPALREAEDPWAAAVALDPERFGPNDGMPPVSLEASARL